MTTPETASHRLADKDFMGMTATCAVCGPVKMRTRGKGRPACANKLAARRAAWAARHPEKALRNRRGKSAHHLTSFDASTRTGECPVCGTVGVVPKGRGWMCLVRAEELWSHQQDVPQQRCPECRKNFLCADGTCPSCSDRARLDWAYALRLASAEADLREDFDSFTGEPLGTVVNPERYDILSTEGDTVANPGLKTIGAGVPRGLNPETYIKKWWAENAHLVEGGTA
jgi:hypothetical protein